jgi:hypothetical protein
MLESCSTGQANRDKVKSRAPEGCLFICTGVSFCMVASLSRLFTSSHWLSQKSRFAPQICRPRLFYSDVNHYPKGDPISRTRQMTTLSGCNLNVTLSDVSIDLSRSISSDSRLGDGRICSQARVGARPTFIEQAQVSIEPVCLVSTPISSAQGRRQDPRQRPIAASLYFARMG